MKIGKTEQPADFNKIGVHARLCLQLFPFRRFAAILDQYLEI